MKPSEPVVVNARHEGAILTGLALVFSATALLAWRPEAGSVVRVEPLPRSAPSLSHRVPRPPRAVPPSPSPTHAEGGRRGGAAREASETVETATSVSVDVLGTLGVEETGGLGITWSLSERYYPRTRWGGRGRWRYGYRGQRMSGMLPGFFQFNDPTGAGAQGCEVFPQTCGSFGVSSWEPTARRTHSVATLQREGLSWVMENPTTRVVVDLERLCALSLQRREGLPGTVAPAPSLLPFNLPDDATTCSVEPSGNTLGVAVVIDWRGSGWSQRATVSLDDEARGPGASLSYSERQGTVTRTTVANLTSARLAWTISDRDVEVEPGQVVQVTAR